MSNVLGYNSFDDLLITEPSLDDLAVIGSSRCLRLFCCSPLIHVVLGISNLGDREKIYYEINPEAALMDAGLLNSRGTGTLSPRANKFGSFPFLHFFRDEILMICILIDDYDFDETPSYGGYDAGGAGNLFSFGDSALLNLSALL